MSASEPDKKQLHAGIDVAWPDVIRFFRQVSHDLRNQLNAVELQSAFVSELATDPELKEEITRLRKMVSECGNALQKLSTRLNPASPNVIAYRGADLVGDLKARIAKEFPNQAPTVEWTNEGNDAQVSVDPQLLLEALLEVFRNAFDHQVPGSSLGFNARTEGDSLILTLYEPKAEFKLATEKWGREPLQNVGRGHYGLGLNMVRTIVAGHEGKLRAQYDSTQSKLITSIALPLAASRD